MPKELQPNAPAEAPCPSDRARLQVERDYQALSAGLLSFLCGRLRNQLEAEDVLHDVFVGYHRQLLKNPIDSAATYLYRAAHRLSLNAIRQRCTAQRHRVALKETHLALRAAPQADAIRAAEARAALCRLDEDAREILHLRVYGGLSFRQMAEVLELPVATVFKRFEDAASELRAALEKKNPRSHHGAIHA